jgi:hypothetical protein
MHHDKALVHHLGLCTCRDHRQSASKLRSASIPSPKSPRWGLAERRSGRRVRERLDRLSGRPAAPNHGPRKYRPHLSHWPHRGPALRTSRRRSRGARRISPVRPLQLLPLQRVSIVPANRSPARCVMEPLPSLKTRPVGGYSQFQYLHPDSVFHRNTYPLISRPCASRSLMEFSGPVWTASPAPARAS